MKFMKTGIILTSLVLLAACEGQNNSHYRPDNERQITTPEPGVTVSGYARVGVVVRR